MSSGATKVHAINESQIMRFSALEKLQDNKSLSDSIKDLVIILFISLSIVHIENH